MNLASLSLEQKVGQLFFIGIPGPDLDAPTRDVLDRVRPGGICLFARNIKSREQTRQLNDALREYLNGPLISVDQEGGLVDRLRRIMTPMPAAGSMRDAADAAALGTIIGRALAILGFNMDFAPVVDVVTAERGQHSNGLYNRPFGESPTEVIEMASAFSAELKANGILNCLKHFPGYGATQVDSHEELPVVEVTEADLHAIDLIPYRKMLPATDSVMIGHTVFPHVALQEADERGKLVPSSLSKALITTLLRDQLNFSGLAITDDLEMGAIIKNYGIGEACVKAVLAGVDMLAICADAERIGEGYRAVLSATKSGQISQERLEQSLTRIQEIKSRIGPSPKFDNTKLEAISSATAELVSRLD